VIVFHAGAPLGPFAFGAAQTHGKSYAIGCGRARSKTTSASGVAV